MITPRKLLATAGGLAAAGYLMRQPNVFAAAPRAETELGKVKIVDVKTASINMLCHNMCTPTGTIASGHACMAIRSFLALESDSVEIPHWQDIILRDGPIYRDGYLEVPNKPGLGIELNEEVCRAHLAEGSGFFDD